ncbi:MAG TPA: four helix bundle protein [Bacteroidota bacterium]|nr:four helix bundle protein [Bacteroidota bacterium]
MGDKQSPRIYDLEERTYGFAKRCSQFAEKVPKTISSVEYGTQLIRASGSVAGNYIEANESLSKKDFVFRIKICRKESKESRLWIRLIRCPDDMQEERQWLFGEATELMKIFGAILTKISKS